MGSLTQGFQSSGAGFYGANQGILQNEQSAAQKQFNDVQTKQQQLAQSLLNQSNGVGPNPAQMLTQAATQGAVNQNAGMLASQKGISPAMASRLAAQNAAEMSQKGAGQGAMLEAQQRMGAQNAYQQNLNAQQAGASGMFGAAVSGQNQAGGINAGLQAQQNAANANMFGGLLQGAGMGAMLAAFSDGGEIQHLDEGSWVSDLESAASSAGDKIKQALNAPGVQQEDIHKQSFLQTKSNAPKEESDSRGYADGDIVMPLGGPALNTLNNAQTSYASKQLGAQMNPQQQAAMGAMKGAFQSDAGSQIANQMLSQAGVNMYAPGISSSQFSGLGNLAGAKIAQNMKSSQQADQDFSDFENAPEDKTPSVKSEDMSFGNPGEDLSFASGGKVPKHLHAVARIYHGDHLQRMPPPEPNMPSTVAALKDRGGHVPNPGVKKIVKGDSPKNDVVPTMLSPGEMVIPKSVMESKDPVQGAADFVASKLKEKHGGRDEDFKKALRSAAGSRGVK